MNRSSDVVLAHDYLTQRGGAERVVLELLDALELDELTTSIYSPNDTYAQFLSFKVRSGALSKLGFFRADGRRALPLLAFAWSARRRVTTGVAICSSSGWSHGLRTSGTAKKIVYCYNPARWLYQSEEYLADQSHLVAFALRMLRPFLREWDKRAAATAHMYIAISTPVAERIRSTYGVASKIIFPPMTLNTSGNQTAVDGLRDNFFLTVGRGRGYKGTRNLIDAFRHRPETTLVVVGDVSIPDCPANVLLLGRVSEEELRWLYSNARALVSTSREDYGLTPIEANAFGTPSLVVRAGGFLDTTNEGVSGRFIEGFDVQSILEGIDTFPTSWDEIKIKQHADRFSTREFRKQLFSAIREVKTGSWDTRAKRVSAQ